MKLKTNAGLMIVVALCGCATTSVKQTWKSPEYSGGPLRKVALLAIDERRDVRIGFENRLSRQMRPTGVDPVTTYDLLSLPEINQDKPAAAARFRSAGATAVVIMRLRDTASFYRESRPGPERYAEVITGYEPGLWYDYYSVAYTSMSPTYGNLKQQVYLETSIFDLATAKRLWSGLTRTSLKENTDRVAEMDPLVAKVVSAMRTDGMIP